MDNIGVMLVRGIYEQGPYFLGAWNAITMYVVIVVDIPTRQGTNGILYRSHTFANDVPLYHRGVQGDLHQRASHHLVSD